MITLVAGRTTPLTSKIKVSPSAVQLTMTWRSLSIASRTSSSIRHVRGAASRYSLTWFLRNKHPYSGQVSKPSLGSPRHNIYVGITHLNSSRRHRSATAVVRDAASVREKRCLSIPKQFLEQLRARQSVLDDSPTRVGSCERMFPLRQRHIERAEVAQGTAP